MVNGVGESSVIAATAAYVSEVARLAGTGRTTEHSFRPALAALIDALAPGLKAVNEPKRTDCGAPDYIMQGVAITLFVKCRQCENVANTNSNSQLENGNIGTGNNGNIGNNHTIRVWINSAQYFDNVPLAAWEQAVGGYRPTEKWLKDRKGRALSQDDISHYRRMILALAKTARVAERLNHSGGVR